MLKRHSAGMGRGSGGQPPSGGCVLKLVIESSANSNAKQPPSGGCVLKLGRIGLRIKRRFAAAFGRLCVETMRPEPPMLAGCGSRLRAAVC